MATDYDAPRKNEEELETDSIEELQARRKENTGSSEVDEDENAAAEEYELPGADLSNEELSVQVIPAQDDEFTCSICYLVQHRSRIAQQEDEELICVDCAE